MNLRYVLSAAVVATAALTATPASATPPSDTGQVCGFSSLTNPFDPSGRRQTGEIDAGPIVIADGADPRAGRVTCTITSGWNHTAPALASASSVTTPGVVYLPPTPIEYEIDYWDVPVICTRVDIVGGGTYYWDDIDEVWSTDPYVECMSWCCDPPPGGDILDEVDEVFIDYVDPVLCPVLAEHAGTVGPVTIQPDGDVSIADGEWWLCPPYED
jgi:hypothetical protein